MARSGEYQHQGRGGQGWRAPAGWMVRVPQELMPQSDAGQARPGQPWLLSLPRYLPNWRLDGGQSLARVTSSSRGERCCWVGTAACRTGLPGAPSIHRHYPEKGSPAPPSTRRAADTAGHDAR
jgi:hypothetical protein